MFKYVNVISEVSLKLRKLRPDFMACHLVYAFCAAVPTAGTCWSFAIALNRQ